MRRASNTQLFTSVRKQRTLTVLNVRRSANWNTKSLAQVFEVGVRSATFCRCLLESKSHRVRKLTYPDAHRRTMGDHRALTGLLKQPAILTLSLFGDHRRGLAIKEFRTPERDCARLGSVSVEPPKSRQADSRSLYECFEKREYKNFWSRQSWRRRRKCGAKAGWL